MRFGAVASVFVLGAAGTSAQPIRQVDAFVSGYAGGTEGYYCFFAPALITAPDGLLLMFCEGHVSNCSDSSDVDIVLKRSSDGGATWDAPTVVVDFGGDTAGNCSPIYDAASGQLLLVFTSNLGIDIEAEICDGTSFDTRRAWLTRSTDLGESWSGPTEITQMVKMPTWRWYATGPGHGIQLKSGRLIIACDHSGPGGCPDDYHSHLIYSDDHGDTWHIGAVADAGTNESTAAELVDGQIYVNMRSYHGLNRRAVALSDDDGLSVGPTSHDSGLIEPVCQASSLRYPTASNGTTRLLFSNPASTFRERISVRVSYDEGNTWSASGLVYAGPSDYSDLALLPDGRIGLAYMRGDSLTGDRVSFASFTLDWLEGRVTSARWDFNELHDGGAPETPGFIRDSTGFAQNATAIGNPMYVLGAEAYGGTRALRFSDGPDRVEFSDNGDNDLFDFDSEDSFTIELVFRTTAHGSGGNLGSGAIVSKDVDADRPSWWVRVQDSGIRFLADDGSMFRDVVSDAAVNDGRWHHVAAVCDRSAQRLRLYLDHALVSKPEDITGLGSLVNDNALVVGAFNKGRREFIGDIDFVRIMREPLAPEDFVQPANSGDANCDGTVDQQDIAEFVNRLSGPQVLAFPSCWAGPDFDHDDDVDMFDFSVFQVAFAP